MPVGRDLWRQPALHRLALPLVSLRVAPCLTPKSTDHHSPMNFGDTALE
jgi:hypothetical protein